MMPERPKASILPSQVGGGAPVLRALGLMTGTVLDGEIDMAIIETDGETLHLADSPDSLNRTCPARLGSYEAETIDCLRQALEDAGRWNFRGAEPEIFAIAEDAITRAQALAVNRFLADVRLNVDLIGFHGHTVLHRPPASGNHDITLIPGKTRQLGNGALMAQLTGLPVAYDFRTRDVDAGGQGAPLAPVYHRALLRRALASGQLPADPESCVVINLGGVANLTWWDGDDGLISFDTGPANAPINDWVRSLSLGDFDRDGKFARGGVVDEQCVARVLAHPYVAAPYPKSCDRNDFTASAAAGLTDRDGAATLTEISAALVAAGVAALPCPIQVAIVCGGGAHNPALLEAIGRRSCLQIVRAEDLGWRSDFIEAECFAFLAVRVVKGLPLSYPGTTSVPEPCCGGRVAL